MPRVASARLVEERLASGNEWRHLLLVERRRWTAGAWLLCVVPEPWEFGLAVRGAWNLPRGLRLRVGNDGEHDDDHGSERSSVLRCVQHDALLLWSPVLIRGGE